YTGAKDVDEAKEAIFRILQNKGEARVIYFHGWSGLGASTVLRSIAEVIPSKRTTPELCFDKIIHIDCSEWKGRRTLQRAIAEELQLDSSIMAILDKQDIDDDFNGVNEISRDEITTVSREIYHNLKDNRFMLIFHSRSDDEIDFFPLGVPSFGKFTENIMIWTYRRRILTITEHEEHKVIQKLRYTHLLAYDRENYLTSGELYALLCKETALIVDDYPCMRGLNPMMVADCYVYTLFLQRSFHNKTSSDWVGVASNCWICDGILQKDITLEICDTLHRDISWECDDNVLTKFKKDSKLPFLVVKEDGVYEEG
uniref:NB-ARC domain-containing protein n=2 Tax=Aegilops tauschii TaxID=37682 RepID=A0A453T5K2_AEGTS